MLLYIYKLIIKGSAVLLDYPVYIEFNDYLFTSIKMRFS